ncbi:MAG: exodeoxyribonuclease VII small subunit [Phycisphaerae bacterium]|nr:exodeoxyribonuclease VII small subunit [Phycisphaerae bacterium]
MAKNVKDKPAPEELTFEQALAELDAIVAAMEQGEVSLADALAQYERGVQLVKRCRVLLGEAEKRIELLGEDEKGKPTTTPLDAATGEDEGQ